MPLESSTQTRAELRAALRQALRRPHKALAAGRLYIPPQAFAAPGRETTLSISPYSLIDCTGNIHLGPWCMIGARSRIYTHDHVHQGREPLLALQERVGILWQDKYIGADVWIHENALILYQVTVIPDGVVIGGGAVLTKNPGPYEIWAGNPARKIGERVPEQAWRLRGQARGPRFSLHSHLEGQWDPGACTTF